jgi:hypothetical protein
MVMATRGILGLAKNLKELTDLTMCLFRLLLLLMLAHSWLTLLNKKVKKISFIAPKTVWSAKSPFYLVKLIQGKLVLEN